MVWISLLLLLALCGRYGGGVQLLFFASGVNAGCAGSLRLGRFCGADRRVGFGSFRALSEGIGKMFTAF